MVCPADRDKNVLGGAAELMVTNWLLVPENERLVFIANVLSFRKPASFA